MLLNMFFCRKHNWSSAHEVIYGRVPIERGPATQFLQRTIDGPVADILLSEVNTLELTPARWTHAHLSLLHISSMGPNGILDLK